MVLFKNLFKFSQKEISFAFDHILDKKYYHGLKVLKAALPDAPVAHGKLLIITPRTAGKAIERNRIRRRIKNIFYQEQCYRIPFSWIIVVGPKATTITFDALKKFLVATMQPRKELL